MSIESHIGKKAHRQLCGLRGPLLDLLPHHRVREQARGGLLGLSRRVRERNVDHLDGDRAVVLDAE